MQLRLRMPTLIVRQIRIPKGGRGGLAMGPLRSRAVLTICAHARCGKLVPFSRCVREHAHTERSE